MKVISFFIVQTTQFQHVTLSKIQIEIISIYYTRSL